MRKIIGQILDTLGIHNLINKIRFYFPTFKKRKRLHKYGLYALNILNDVFEKHGCFFWLEFGTLLGAFRDKGFINHDFDIDLGVLSENRILNLNQILKPLGFIKTRELFIPDVGVTEETYVYKGLHIDIFYFFEDETNIVCYSSTAAGEEYWRDVINTIGLLMDSYTFKNTGFEKQKLYNSLFYFPKDTDLHLKECYGNYTVKIKKWSDNKCSNQKHTEKRCFHSDVNLSN